ncbi:MAG: hypothetical protein NT007_10175 [Candidatus Kapabacteria bacterium]|nr:hypothetical protein [Candidatus Kapabacteria bacterium]
MIKNYFYLIVGILSILFSFTHAMNGQITVLSLINLSKLDIETQTTIFYIWHILSAENFIFGVAFIIMGFHKDLSRVKFAALMIAFIMISRLLVIFGSILLKNMNNLTNSLTDFVAIIIFVGLIILGTRKKSSISISTSEKNSQ